VQPPIGFGLPSSGGVGITTALLALPQPVVHPHLDDWRDVVVWRMRRRT